MSCDTKLLVSRELSCGPGLHGKLLAGNIHWFLLAIGAELRKEMIAEGRDQTFDPTPHILKFDLDIHVVCIRTRDGEMHSQRA
jgi:hypothetical protein